MTTLMIARRKMSQYVYVGWLWYKNRFQLNVSYCLLTRKYESFDTLPKWQLPQPSCACDSSVLRLWSLPFLLTFCTYIYYLSTFVPGPFSNIFTSRRFLIFCLLDCHVQSSLILYHICNLLMTFSDSPIDAYWNGDVDVRKTSRLLLFHT